MRPKLLDLFCGAGGAGMGYHLAGFDVVGVDHIEQPRYPFEFHCADAFEFCQKYGHMYDVIHASPPCQAYSCCTPVEYRGRHPDLIDPVRELLESTGKPFIIENVSGARRLLREPVMLCGTMFGLPLWRHRYFEIWPRLPLSVYSQLKCKHDGPPVLVTGRVRFDVHRKTGYSVAEKRAAMQIEWMTTKELDEAIPPAYTQWIGTQILAQL